MVIDGYFVSECWWLLIVLILVATMLMAIGGYFIGGY